MMNGVANKAMSTAKSGNLPRIMLTLFALALFSLLAVHTQARSLTAYL
jgi:hypothetical protein